MPSLFLLIGLVALSVSTPSESNPKIGTFAKESTPTTITAFENLEFNKSLAIENAFIPEEQAVDTDEK